MITARFGAKSFEVKKDKIYTPDGLKISESLSTEETEVAGKKPTLTIKGTGLQSISMSLKLDCRFVDVDVELRYWKLALHNKKSYMLTVGMYDIGQMFLTQYEATDIVLAKDGRYISAMLSLTFTEDGAFANKTLTAYTISTKKVNDVKQSTTTKKINNTIKKGTIIKPKSGVRWYDTAENAIKKKGKSGKAYQNNMKVTYTYSKKGKIVCVNPNGSGWLKVEDVTIIRY